jgi:hypothetical protein
MITARTKLGLEMVAVALALGVLGDALLRAVPWGLNITLGVTTVVGLTWLLVRRHGIVPSADAPWLALTALLLGVAFVRRDAQVLASFDAMALIATLGLGALSLQGERIAPLRALDYLHRGATAVAGTVAGGLQLVFQDVQWNELSKEGRWRQARAVALGAVIAVPLLVVFGALFASADEVFGNVLKNVFAFDAETALSHTFLTIFCAAVAAGYLRWSLIARPGAATLPIAGASLGIVPVATALGLVTLLFLMFVVVQLRYFFGGATLVEQTTGLTYAEYARRGFFELVTASGLVLPMLLGADHLVRGAQPAHLRLFRSLAGVLLVLLAVVMASALGRMRLYVQAFGLSEIRLYATAFMVYLFGVFGWFAATVLRGQHGRFAFGALIQGYAVLAGLHVINSDAFIVRTNLHRVATVAERPFDTKYALSLGADAVPRLLEALPTLPERDRCDVAAGLLKKWGENEARPDGDWRGWNWSRARTRRLVRAQAEALRTITCDAPVKEVT